MNRPANRYTFFIDEVFVRIAGQRHSRERGMRLPQNFCSSNAVNLPVPSPDCRIDVDQRG